jgi:hypothetical protein
LIAHPEGVTGWDPPFVLAGWRRDRTRSRKIHGKIVRVGPDTRGDVMISYRIYTLDDTDHIAGFIEGDYASDQEALAAARQVPEPDTFAEVWQLARCLGKVRGARDLS